MEEKGTDKVIAFDTLFTTNQIQMLKVLITYLPPENQRSLAIYIKFMELQYTMDFFQRYPNASLPGLPYEASPGTAKLCDEILPLCDPEQRNKIGQLKGMYQTFENMQEMLEMLQMMKELFPQDDTGSNNGDFLSGLAGLSGMPGMPDLGGIDLSQLMNLFSSGTNTT